MSDPQTVMSTSQTVYLNLTAHPRSIRISAYGDGHRVSLGFFDGPNDVDLVFTPGSLAALVDAGLVAIANPGPAHPDGDITPPTLEGTP